jgi:hypothetical protein
MSNSVIATGDVRLVHSDDVAYARERIVAWCSKQYPDMTLGMVQHLAILLAVERQKATTDAQPRRERRVCMPITLPAPDDAEDEITEPRGVKR